MHGALASLVDGVGALLAGVGFLAVRPRAWPIAAVPALIATVLAVAAIWLSFDTLGPWLSELAFADTDEGGWTSVAKGSLRWFGSLLAAYVSLLLAPTLSAPALEHLVRLQEEALGAPPRPRRGFWFELRCELEAQLVGLGVLVPLTLALWVLGPALPPLLPFIALLNALLVSLAVAWNLLGYPLTLRGIGARERVRRMARHAPAVLGFGAAFAGDDLQTRVQALIEKGTLDASAAAEVQLGRGSLGSNPTKAGCAIAPRGPQNPSWLDALGPAALAALAGWARRPRASRRRGAA